MTNFFGIKNPFFPLKTAEQKSLRVPAIRAELEKKYVRRARKCRLMGSAALDLAYVACGRLHAT